MAVMVVRSRCRLGVALLVVLCALGAVHAAGASMLPARGEAGTAATTTVERHATEATVTSGTTPRVAVDDVGTVVVLVLLIAALALVAVLVAAVDRGARDAVPIAGLVRRRRRRRDGRARAHTAPASRRGPPLTAWA